MKRTIYELLGMVKDGKAPKKIMFLGNTYKYDEIDKTYRTIIGNTNIGQVHYLEFYLDYEVEILEEEKKIPEKLEILNANEHSKEVYYENYSKQEISLDIETLQIWVNKIIDYLKSKGDE